MTTKKLWLSWLYLFILTAVLGFIPQPTGFAWAVLFTLGLCFFIPGFWLVRRADIRDDLQTIRRVGLAAIIALCLDLLLICVNMASALLTKVWGDVLYVFMVILTAPMVCGQAWVVVMFGWACLLFYCVFVLKKDR